LTFDPNRNILIVGKPEDNQMITIYQIQPTEAQYRAHNAGQFTPAIEAKRDMMMGTSCFSSDVLKYYTCVAKVNTNDLEEAFELTNLWDDMSKVEQFTRMSSTSVGDIFGLNEHYYMVDTFGFKELHVFNDEVEVLEAA